MDTINKDGKEYKATRAGLPNTCAGSGLPIEGDGYAVNDEQARCGQVFSREFLQPTPAPKTVTETVSVIVETAKPKPTTRTVKRNG